MSDSCRRSLFVVFSIVALMAFAGSVYAECDTECDPYTSYCSDACDVCRRWGIDGCIAWRESTCGEHLAGCLQDNCYPNWVETSRTNVGTYDGRSLCSCDHHRVDSVTKFDYNYCNINSAFWTLNYCDNYIDDGISSSCFYPSCCDEWGDNGTWMTCNGYHSCS